jgi:trehalose-phosphatase
MEAGPGDLDGLLAPLRERAGDCAVLSDIDGTLAPIVDDPGAAAVPAATREALGTLVGRFAVVGCISGRRALEARRIVGRDDIFYAGNHGFELLAPGEDEPRSDPAVGGREEAARRFVESLDPDELAAAGIRLEDKGVIQALHWRGAADSDAAEERTREVSRRAQAADLVPRRGRRVLELRPIAGIDKGSAAFRLLREGAGARGGGRIAGALFGGDDETDLDAFRAIRWMRDSDRLALAVCIGIASEEQPADLEATTDAVVTGPEGYLRVLRELAG